MVVLNLVHRLREYHVPAGSALLVTFLLVGSVAGLGAVVLRWLIRVVSHVSLVRLPDATAGWGPTYVVIAPLWVACWSDP